MSIYYTIEKELSKVEKILIKSGLYQKFTYQEEIKFEGSTYDPVTGSYTGQEANDEFEFNAVTLGQRSGVLEDNSYTILMDIIVMYENVEFEMRSGLEFKFDSNNDSIYNQIWNVSTFKLNPVKSAYEITLGRK